jgi:hypothetical protein
MIDNDLDPTARGDDDHISRADARAENAEERSELLNEQRQQDALDWMKRQLRNEFDKPDGDDPIGAHDRRVVLMTHAHALGFRELHQEMVSDMYFPPSNPSQS